MGTAPATKSLKGDGENFYDEPSEAILKAPTAGSLAEFSVVLKSMVPAGFTAMVPTGLLGVRGVGTARVSAPELGSTV